MTTTSWIAERADGTQETYASRRELRQAIRTSRGPRTIVDSWPASYPPPTTSDARAWDRWREIVAAAKRRARAAAAEARAGRREAKKKEEWEADRATW